MQTKRFGVAAVLAGMLAAVLLASGLFSASASAQSDQGDPCIVGTWTYTDASSGGLHSSSAPQASGTWTVDFPSPDSSYATISVDGADNGEVPGSDPIIFYSIPLIGNASVSYTVNGDTGRVAWGYWHGIPGLLGEVVLPSSSSYTCDAYSLTIVLPPTTAELHFSRVGGPPNHCVAGVGPLGLPDFTCTPGRTDVRLLSDRFCEAGYTEGSGVRYISPATKRAVLRLYGLKQNQIYGWQIDHLVPLALGGANTVQNLWPEESWQRKNRIEGNARKWICKLWLSANAQRNLHKHIAIHQQAQCEFKAAQQGFQSGWPIVEVDLQIWNTLAPGQVKAACQLVVP